MSNMVYWQQQQSRLQQVHPGSHETSCQASPTNTNDKSVGSDPADRCHIGLAESPVSTVGVLQWRSDNAGQKKGICVQLCVDSTFGMIIGKKMFWYWSIGLHFTERVQVSPAFNPSVFVHVIRHQFLLAVQQRGWYSMCPLLLQKQHTTVVTSLHCKPRGHLLKHLLNLWL